MSAQNYTEFGLSKNAYAAFDAVSLKSLIIDRLKASNVFTDQAFEGSNLSAIIDIIAYSYHVSLFYLNNQASESYFQQAEIFENMNKLVNLIGYNPLGAQTSVAAFEATASDSLAVGNYIIPKFSYAVANGIYYSTVNDIYFEKTKSGEEVLDSIGQQNMLYQGQIKEYPTQNAIGEPFEIVTVAIDNITENNRFIDYNNIFVYVRDNTTQMWSEWQVVDSLFAQQRSSKVFEKRLNDGGRYELKFGDDITGKKLNANDLIAIYYLQSDGSGGVISAQGLNNVNIVRYTTPRYRTIFPNIYSATDPIITQNELNAVAISNTNRSTDSTPIESVESIRTNAPKIFATQNRAVTVDDYDSIIKRNFSNLIRDVKTISNTEYINQYIKYFYDIGLRKPNRDSRVLLNQVRFADACDFNNVYSFVVPRNFAVQNAVPQALSTNFKQLIVNKLQGMQLQSAELIPCDPVYIALDIGAVNLREAPTVGIRDTSMLVIKKSTNTKVSANQIKASVVNIIKDYFSVDKLKLGSFLDLSILTSSILNVVGVDSIYTTRTDDNVQVQGISLIQWNPMYEIEDVSIITQNVTFPVFKYPFLVDVDNLASKITVI